MKGAGVNQELEAALQRCRLVAKRKARNFYWGMKLAPEPKRAALYVIYAWMREADDIADDRARRADARAGLRRFAERTERALNGECAPDELHHLWVGLRSLREKFNVTPAHFQAVLDGQHHDLDHVEFATFDQLRHYCEQVASSVGLLCVEIWGARDQPRAAERAIERGIAFQLTNVLRDFAEDYHRGRVYLPAEDFRRHAISPQVLRAWSEPARCARFMNEQIARARSYYEQSATLDELIESDCRPVLAVMTEIYRSLLEKISRHSEQGARGTRIRLSLWRKMAIAARAARTHKGGPIEAAATPEPLESRG